MAFSGDLVLMSPPELLGFLGRHSQSGRLTIGRGDGPTMSLHLQEGVVHVPLFPAIDSGRSGRITRNAHEEILARGRALLPRLRGGEAQPARKTPRRRQDRGDILLKGLRRLPEQDRETRSSWVEGIVHRALLWMGTFRFSPGPLPAWLLDAVLNEEVWTRQAAQLALDGARFRDDSTRFCRADLQARLAQDSGGQPASFQGDLAGIGLAGVLESLQATRRSGTLEVGDDKLSIDLVFQQGKTFVMRREAGDGTASFAREFLDVEHGTARWNLQDEPTGCVHENELAEDMREAVREPLFALLVHDEAKFRFVDEELPDDFEEPEEGTARIELHTDRFLLEAIQRLTEWDTVRRLVGHRDVVRFLDRKLRASLIAEADADTRELLTLIDGQRSFGELLERASLGRLEAGRLVRAWIEDEVLVVGAPAEVG